MAWQDAEPLMSGLLAANNPVDHNREGEQSGRHARAREPLLADARIWPKPVAATPKKEPMQVAALPYKTSGFLVDIDLSGSASSYTFLSGTTYYIAQSFYVSPGPLTFQPGCVIKYGWDAWLLIHGPISCPPVGQLMPVLTSKDDDLFGSMIPGSTHNPTYSARQAILVYYVEESQTEIKNVRFRWATKGIEYDAYGGVAVAHTLRDSLFQNCYWGVYADLPDGSLSLINVKKCNIYYIDVECNCGTLSGQMTEDCGPLYTVANFPGIKNLEAQINPPDTMGAVGSNHFMVLLNEGGNGFSVAVYDKYTGTRVSPANTTAAEFLALTVTNGPYAGTYPTSGTGGVFDPRIIYDHGSQRWFATMLDTVSEHVLLAVSNGSDPVGSGGPTWVSDNWRKYLVPFGPCETDFDQLGVDANAIYVHVVLFPGPPNCTATQNGILAALPKAPFLNGSAQTVQTNFMLDAGGIIIPTVNFEPIATNAPAWFLTAGLLQELRFNALNWVNGFNAPPEWQYGSWGSLSVTNPAGPPPFDAPQLGSSIRIRVGGAKPTMAMIRSLGGNQYLWTCRTVGVNRNGTHTIGMPDDRPAIEWFKIQTTPSVAIVDTGRIYDTAVSAPKFYYYPSLAVNRNSDMVIGFSGSSVNDYVGAYYTGRVSNGTWMSSPVRYAAGKDWFGIDRFGDYSYTTLDPDGITIWTIQEYAETLAEGPLNWGTWIAAVRPF